MTGVTSRLAAAEFDPAFDAGVLRFGAGRAVKVQSDGKVIVGGLFTFTNGMTSAGNLARFNPDGSLDTAFRTANGTGANGPVYAIGLQSDGKIVIAGNFTTFNGVTANRVARLNADGSLDSTFNVGVGPNDAVLALAIQPADNKVIIGGVFTNVAGTSRNRIARLNANGTHDTTFNPGTGANDAVWDIAIDSSDRPVIVGRFTNFNGAANVRNRIARLTTGGALDGTIAFTGGADGAIFTVELDSNGRFLIGGNFSNYNGTARNRVARLTAGGALDTTFDIGTGVAGDYVAHLQLDSAGRVLVGGRFFNFNNDSNGVFELVRLTSTGARDTTFAPVKDNYVNYGWSGVQAVAVGEGDAIFAVGYFYDRTLPRAGLTKLTPAGLRDPTFDVGEGLLDQPYVDVRPGAGGKYYLLGLFDWVRGAPRSNLARFLPNGTLDTFEPNGYFGEAWFDSTVTEVVEAPGGDVWVFGSFTQYSGLLRERAVRFNRFGTPEIDATADELKIQGGAVRRARIDASGRLVLAGLFTSINGTARAGVARLSFAANDLLALDSTFNPGTGPAGGTVWELALDSAGRALVAGDFTAFSGTTETGLVRLSSTGAVDTAFAANVALNGAVYAVDVLAEDKLLIGGAFTNSGGFAVNRIDRLNANGASDPTFNPGTGMNGYVRQAIEDASGRLVAIGGFTTVRDEVRVGLARLGANGAADDIFGGDQIQPTGSAYGLLELGDGKLLVSGALTHVNGQRRPGLARFHNVAVRRGELATSLTGATLANGEVRGVLPLPDGKFLLVGDFTNVSGVALNRVAKVDQNGVVDATFVVGAGANAAVNGALLEPDGKILLYGAFTAFNNTSATFLLRLNPDGTRDTSFTPSAPSGEVRAVVRLDNGQYLLAGAFANLGGTAAGRVARLHASGTRDTTFSVGAGADATVHTLVRASDGSIFAGGAFQNFAGAAAPGVVKLTGSGARASGFDIGTGVPANSTVRVLHLQTDGRLIVGGEFSTFNGAATGPLVRLNANGARDTTYTAGVNGDGAVFALTRLAMSHLAVAGSFTTLGGGERRGFAVLDDAGRINGVFDVGAGFNNSVFSLAQTADGRLAAAGAFTNVNGTARNRFTLLYAGYAAAPSTSGSVQTVEVEPGIAITLTCGTTDSAFSYQWFKNGVRIEGATAATYEIASPGLNDAALYTTRISNGAGEAFTAGTQLIVKLAPIIATAPVAQAVGYGAGAEFAVGVVGPGPFTYQWYRDGVLIPGATSSSYSLGSVGPTDFGATFTVRITGPYGTTETAPVAVTFDPAAVPGSVSTGFTLGVAISVPHALVRATDGKLYVGGSGYLHRLNADGSRDTTFVPALTGGVTVRALAVQADGKLLIGGQFTAAGNVVGVARLNPDGSLDTAFTPATVRFFSNGFEFNSSNVLALAVQADGKILVGGEFQRVAGADRWHLARLNANGTIDTTFVTNSVLDANNNVTTRNGPDGLVRAIHVQGSNIIIAGDFTLYRTSTVNRLARILQSNAAVDTNFAGGTRANGAITSLAVDSTGKLVLAGAFTAYNGTARNGLVRVDANGALDATFNPGAGPQFNPVWQSDAPKINAATVLPDDSIVAVGYWRSFSGWPSANAVRLTSTGAFDTQWAVPLAAGSNYVGAQFLGVHALPDGRVLVRAYFNGPLVRLEGGTFPPEPPSFLTQPFVLNQTYAAGSALTVPALATGPGTMSFQWLRNGSPVAGATSPTLSFTSIRAADAGTYTLRATSNTTGSVTSNPVVINVGAEATGPGSIDLGWSFNGSGFGYFRRLALGADGSYFLATYDDRGRIHKFDANGAPLPAFSTGTGFEYEVMAMVAQSDGKVVVGGYFSNYNGTTRRNLARLNADGTLETAYNPNPTGTISGDVYALALQPDGKVVVGGLFTNIAGTARDKVARLLTTGAIDGTFVPGAHGLTRVDRILLASDGANAGKVYLLGYGSVSGTTDIVRLNSNGTVDNTFARISASTIGDVALDASGRLVVVGSFNTIGGQNVRNVARVSTAGVVEANFGPVRSAGASSGISRVFVGGDGYIYLGISSGSYDGFTLGDLVRLDPNGKLDVNFPAPGASSVNGTFTGAAWVNGKLVLAGVSASPRSGLVRLNAGEISPIAAPQRVKTSGDRTTTQGATLSHSAQFTGSSTLTYQWRKDGQLIAGAASPQLTFGALAASDAGTYTLTATNTQGSATATFVLTLLAPDPLSPVAGINVTSGFSHGSIAQTHRYADGRVLIAGNFSAFNNTTSRGLVRLNADGTHDTAFSAALPIGTSHTSIESVRVLADGRIIVTGTLSMTNGTTAHVVRLLSTGALDAVLLAATDISEAPHAAIAQADGKVIIAGTFTTVRGTARSGLARLNTNGTLDTAYATGGAQIGQARALHLDPSGRLLISGTVFSVGGQVATSLLVRLNLDGTLDPSFAPGVANMPENFFRASDGRLFVYGLNTAAQLPDGPTMIAQIGEDGVVNPAFRQPVQTYSLADDADGRLYAVLSSGSSRLLARLLPGGGIDRSVATSLETLGGAGTNSLLLAVASSGGSLNGLNVPGLTYFNLGTVDTTLSVATSPPATVALSEGAQAVLRGDFRGAQGATLQWLKDGQPIAGANTTALLLRNVTSAANGSYTLRATRAGVMVTTTPAVVTVTPQLGRAGEVELPWAAGLTVTNASGVVRDAAGNFYVFGPVRVNGRRERAVVAFDSAGVERTDFIVSPRVIGFPQQVLPLPDGKLLLSGSSAGLALDGVQVGLIRLHADGSVDDSFTIGTARSTFGSSAPVRVHRLADGRLLAIGSFATYNNETVAGVVRLSSDGVRDTSFTAPEVSGEGTFLPAPNGKWWLLGISDTTTFSPYYFVRLNADGTRDTAFAPPVRYGNEGVQAAPLPGGGMLLVSLRFVDSSTRVTLRRVLPDGTFDADFLPPVLAMNSANNPSIGSIATDAAGRLLLGGNFDRVNGVPRGGVVRLTSEGHVDPSFVPSSRSGTAAVRALFADPDRVVVFGDVQFGGVNDRSGLQALRTTPTPGANAAPVLAAEWAATLIQPFYPLVLGLPVYAPATAAVQWYRNGEMIPGATALTYRKEMVTEADAGLYHAVVSTPGGSLSVPPVQISVPSTAYAGGFGERNAAADIQGAVRHAVRQADGRILVLAENAFVDRRGPFQLFRLNADGTFHSGLPTRVYPSPTDSSVSTSLVESFGVDAAGRIYLAGSFTTISGVARAYLARLLPDGSVDGTWNPNPNQQVRRLAVQPDGKLLVAGSFSQIAGSARPGVARLASDGSLDPSFAPISTGFNSQVEALLPLNGGGFIAAGFFTTYGGVPANRIARIDSTGALDSTFTASVNNVISALAVLSDGRLVIAGNFSQVNGTSRSSPAILSADGALDPTNLGNNSSNQTLRLTVAADDTIYLSNNTNVLRFAQATTIDNAFNNAQQATQRGTFNTAPGALIAQGNDVMVAGVFSRIGTTPRNGLVWLRGAAGGDGSPILASPPVGQTVLEGRNASFSVTALTASGTLTYAWNRVGDPALLSTASTLNLANVTPAMSGQYRVAISNGTALTEAFATLTVTPAPASMPGFVRFGFVPVNGLSSQTQFVTAPDGALLARSGNNLLQIDPVTGAQIGVHLAFTPTGGGVAGMRYDATGRLYVWGNFTGMNGHTTTRLARFTAAGVIDPSFVSSLSTTHTIRTVDFASDGGVYVAGTLANLTIAGRPSSHLVRLTETGAIDDAFDPAGGFDVQLEGITVLPDGRLFAFGSFTTVGGQSRSGLVRLLPNGTIDPTFANLAISNVRQVHQLPDGRLLVNKGDPLVNGLSRPGIVRLSADGDVDAEFRLPDGFAGITDFIVRPDGRIVARGFVTLNFNSRPVVVQFLPDGALDPSFDSERNFWFVQTNGNLSQGNLTALFLLPDGDLLVSGSFNRIDDGIMRTNVVRLHGSPLPPVIVTPPASANVNSGVNVTFSVALGGGTAPFTYQWRRNGSPLDGATAATLTLTNVTVGQGGDYTVVVSNDAGSVTSTAATLVVTPAQQAQTITFAPLANRPFTLAPITLSASASSGLPVGFEIVSGLAAIDGNLLTLLGTGSITVRATQPGNGTWLPAPPVERTFTITPDFYIWLLETFTEQELANPALTGPNADYDRDGYSNLVEYALGRDPKVASNANAPAVAASASEWTFTYTRPADRSPEITYVVEVSTNLTTWTTANVTHERTATGPTETWRARVPLTAGANLFFRLRVER